MINSSLKKKLTLVIIKATGIINERNFMSKKSLMMNPLKKIWGPKDHFKNNHKHLSFLTRVGSTLAPKSHSP